MHIHRRAHTPTWAGEWGRQRGAKQPKPIHSFKEKERESERATARARASSSVASLFPLLLLLAPVCVRVCLCVCVFECALRAKLIFLFIKKIKIYLYFRLLRGVHIYIYIYIYFFMVYYFVAAAKNIIYVLFMIFISHLAFCVQAFRRFVFVRVCIETCLIYTERHLDTAITRPQRAAFSYFDSGIANNLFSGTFVCRTAFTAYFYLHNLL